MAEQIDENASIDYYNHQPAKRTGGGVLIFNTLGQLLLVKPNYRNTWAWPGGGSDEGEAPLQTAVRETQEEIGYTPRHLLPAFVDYISPKPDGSKDTIHFVYREADEVNLTFIDDLVLQTEEIDAVRWTAIDELSNFVKPYRAKQIETYLAHQVAGAMLYLEDGSLPHTPA